MEVKTKIHCKVYQTHFQLESVVLCLLRDQDVNWQGQPAPTVSQRKFPPLYSWPEPVLHWSHLSLAAARGQFQTSQAASAALHVLCLYMKCLFQ